MKDALPCVIARNVAPATVLGCLCNIESLAWSIAEHGWRVSNDHDFRYGFDTGNFSILTRGSIILDSPSRLECQSNSRIYICNTFFCILSPSLGIISSNLSNLSPGKKDSGQVLCPPPQRESDRARERDACHDVEIARTFRSCRSPTVKREKNT